MFTNYQIPDTKHRSIDVLRSLEWMRSVKYFMRKDCALITPEQDIAQMGVGANKVSSMQSETSHVKKKKPIHSTGMPAAHVTFPVVIFQRI